MIQLTKQQALDAGYTQCQIEDVDFSPMWTIKHCDIEKIKSEWENRLVLLRNTTHEIDGFYLPAFITTDIELIP